MWIQVVSVKEIFDSCKLISFFLFGRIRDI